MHSGTRLTCEPCRERKVKCNRVFPECNRCARLGYKCTYRDRVSHRASQAAVIQQLQERMSQAEARLAIQGITVAAGTPSPPSQYQTIVAAGGSISVPPSSSSASSIAGSVPRSAPHHQQSESPIDMSFNPGTSVGVGLGRGYNQVQVSMVQDTPTLQDFDFTALDSTGFEHHTGNHPNHADHVATDHSFGLMPSLEMEMGSPIMDWHQIRRTAADDAPSMHFRSISLSTDEATGSIAAEDLGYLHRIFFDTFATVMPILYKERFYRELQESPNNLALKSVSYTISLLAILVSEQYRHLERRCYTLARRYIEACESDDEANTLTNINFFQALLFLTRYELARRTCTRASMALGRAIRLGRMLRLDELDKKGNEAAVSRGIIALPQIHLRPTQDMVEMEERRRCLWALYILEGYSTIHTGSLGSLNDETIFVSLPVPGNLDNKLTPTQMPTLVQATSSIQNPEELIAPFTGAIFVVYLLRKIIIHTIATDSSKASQNSSKIRRMVHTTHHSSPGFWDRHYSLLKECNEYGNLLRHCTAMRVIYADPLAFNVYMTFCAIELRLWEAAVDEAEQTGLPTAESMRQLQACAFKIANTVRVTWGVQRMTCDNMSLSGAFVAWPLCMAIKGLNRQHEHSHVSSSSPFQHHQQDAQTLLLLDDGSGNGSGSNINLKGNTTNHHGASTEETNERTTLLQMLHAALDEVEVPTGPWHQSIAGLLALHLQQTSPAVTY